MRLRSFEYLDGWETNADEDNLIIWYNINNHLIEIKHPITNQILELIPTSVLRNMIPYDTAPPPRKCNRCGKVTCSRPCHNCQR